MKYLIVICIPLLLAPALPQKCYKCKRTELSARHGFVVTDSLETCDSKWVKENSYPEEVQMNSTWHCKEKKF